MTVSTTNPAAQSQVASSRRRRSPLRLVLAPVLDLFSSVRFGIVLLILLFLYMAVGSAGLVYPVAPNIFSAESWVHEQVRQRPLLEMTEFEWFHWWPFDVLVALIATTLIVTTLRRIRLSVINLGVWMIHTGIVVLIVGSLIYFATKVEGDTPISRRMLTISLLDEDGTPAGTPLRLNPFAGNEGVLAGADGELVKVSVLGTDPEWELLSGDDAGTRAFSVNLMIDGFEKRFIRQVIAGYPEFTEDLIQTDDPQQPVQRSVKVNGTRLIESSLLVDLDYAPQDEFYLSEMLSKNWALYLREKGTQTWIERPVAAARPLDPRNVGVPLYNDKIADPSSVFVTGAQPRPASQPLSVVVDPVSPEDPLPDTPIRIDSYLRYAQLSSRIAPGGPTAPLNPVMDVTLSSDQGDRETLQFRAFDPERSSVEDGVIAFRFVRDEAEFASLLESSLLTVEIPELGIRETRTLDSLGEGRIWELADGNYRISIGGVQEDLVLTEGTVSVVFADITTPSGMFRRWVFDNPILTRDVDPDNPMPGPQDERFIEEGIQLTYTPGRGAARLLFVAGPDPDRLRVVANLGAEGQRVEDLPIARPVAIRQGISLLVNRYIPRALEQTAPLIVPPSQREREMGNLFSWVRALVPGSSPTWLQFQKYPFKGPEDLLGRYRSLYTPTTILAQDASGTPRQVEVVFSRRRMKLPEPIALETFELDTHIGGFSGATASIRDYRSILRFLSEGEWSAPVPVSVNKPAENGGLWYFQAQWDPPIEASINGGLRSSGLGYTVLGVGNRNGVFIQLLGCAIAVAGMIYAFYVKPMIKRRRREKMIASLAAREAAA